MFLIPNEIARSFQCNLDDWSALCFRGQRGNLFTDPLFCLVDPPRDLFLVEADLDRAVADVPSSGNARI
jgi:hypothetical protein